jgi:hypothetical protein
MAGVGTIWNMVPTPSVRLYHQLLEWFEIANYVHLYAVDVTVDHIVFSRVDHAEEYLHLLVLGSNVLCGLQRLRYERDSGKVDLIFFRSSVVLTNPVWWCSPY